MRIIALPELKQLCPWLVSVVLIFNPRFLIVARDQQPTCKLSPDEAMMIVGGGINQVTDQLFTRPFTGFDCAIAFRLCDLLQSVVRSPDRALEIFQYTLHLISPRDEPEWLAA